MTSFSDDFNRADSSSLGAGWVEVSGDWSIVSNQLSPGAAGGTIILRAATAMAGSDHYAQFTIAATAAASQGIWCRGNLTGGLTSGYLWRNDGSSWDLFSVVGGSFTVIGSYAAAAAPGDVGRVQAVGSTIKALVNGVERVSVTDTSVPTGASVGIRSESAGAIRFDDFAAADVTSGAPLGTASETDSAQPLTGAKATALTQVAEQDAAQSLTASKTAPIGAVDTVEAAQPLTAAKTSSLTPVVEQDAAQPFDGGKTAVLGTAGALETARPLAGTKTTALPTVLEIDTARPLVVPSTTVPSSERTYRVPAERRRLTVAAEHRTLTVRR